MEVAPAQTEDEIRAAEVIGSLCLATDLAMGLPFENGLQSTLLAMHLADELGLDADERVETYYGCLLFYAGCTADAEVSAELFPTRRPSRALHARDLRFAGRDRPRGDACPR